MSASFFNADGELKMNNSKEKKRETACFQIYCRVPQSNGSHVLRYACNFQWKRTSFGVRYLDWEYTERQESADVLTDRRARQFLRCMVPRPLGADEATIINAPRERWQQEDLWES